MKVMKMLLAVAVAGASIPALPTAAAAETWSEEQDAYFMSCVNEYVTRNMGSPDAAAAYCYERAYGSERTGGGEPNTRTYPGPGNQCWGSFNTGCNPNVRPD